MMVSGHDAGDQVLTAFCRLATSLLRPTDLFARIGGEEFASRCRTPAGKTGSGCQSDCVPPLKRPPTSLESTLFALRSVSASQSRTMQIVILSSY